MNNKNNDFKNDPIKFIKSFRHGLNSQTKKLETLPLLEFEKSIINHIHNNKYSIISKSRQMHLSSILVAYATWNMIFKNNYSIVVIENNLINARKFKKLVLDNINNIPPELFNSKSIITNNKKNLVLKNGSNITTTTSSIRGYSKTIDMLIFDECAFMNNIENIYYELSSSINAKNGKIIIGSTPNYQEDFFTKTCEFSKKGISLFHLLELHWTKNPYYNQNLKKIKNTKLPELYSYSNEWYQTIKRFFKDSETLNAELNLQPKKINKNKNQIVSFRLEQETIAAIENKLLLKGNDNISEYLRGLIDADLKK